MNAERPPEFTEEECTPATYHVCLEAYFDAHSIEDFTKTRAVLIAEQCGESGAGTVSPRYGVSSGIWKSSTLQNSMRSLPVMLSSGNCTKRGKVPRISLRKFNS
ncbi:hypothetical protein HPB48_019025 [Haemaphysalis longicornis]|uniref:Uncharacterized protein n=1 Tax=Haemaphysalis longicornis TaxID=44386 RepID=A0A9J6FCJ1_HAELO|nr:hypothetical protein HPB48_019025 [Haemaphysalis longicornis]